MKIIEHFIEILILIIFLSSCAGGDDGKAAEQSSWDKVKNSAYVEVFLTSEYNTPSKLNIATLGWEDGINISRDGLNIYATYIPADFLSFVLSGDTIDNLQYYDRGPHYDMDFVTNPAAATYPWYQSDIIYASRASVSENFSPWYTSGMKRSSYSEGALSAVFLNSTSIDICVFTSNENYLEKNNFKIITGTTPDPSGIGNFITATDPTGTSLINTKYTEDNPHIERLNTTDLVLFFDSEDRPGGAGSHDLWYSVSSNNGSDWSVPVNVSSINTADKEHQPHLFYDGTDWWLYYSAYHTDLKLAIFRAKQGTPGDWNSWGSPEIVIGAGNTSGIGEPTLTDNGDLYFVAIYENPDGTDHDRYDADAWVALKK
ncbi:MAG: exo-alpha-sialidase [Spirochaetes bacterium]|nr:exo-alpha-sialidase [Spirochaetota bacterium]